MNRIYRKTQLVVITCLCLLAGQTHAQDLTVSDVLDSWDIVTKMVVESAKLMPAEDYSYKPLDPLRNFANQINHTTASNIGFAQSVKAGQPNFAIPDRSNPPQDKEAVVDLLEKSFQYFRGGLANLNESDLEEMVAWGHPSNPKQITRMKAIMIVLSHLQREHGKTIMYLSAKGIKPAPSGSWAF